MNGNRVLGVLALALAAAYYLAAAAMPETLLADAVGPQGLPKAYATVLAGLSLILIVAPGRRARVRGPAEREPLDNIVVLRRVAGLLLIGVLYVALVPWLGYIVSIAGLIAATIYYQGGGLNGRAVLVAISGAIVFWALFVWVLRIPQPPGVWPSFL